MSSEHGYEITRLDHEQDIIFLFVSTGDENILKAIEYSLIGNIKGYEVFNLGFGNYDFEKDNILDLVVSNNGDTYEVFNTILSSVQAFFEVNPKAMILIRGGDSSKDFEIQCRRTCIRKCVRQCRKKDRRINIYRSYLERNLYWLNLEYQFFGSFAHEKDHFMMEDYRPGEEYLSLFLIKK